ncbi:MAG: hypothetical protein V5A34_07320 [Halapricum sp.]
MKSGTFSALGLAGIGASGIAQGGKATTGDDIGTSTTTPDGVKMEENNNFRIIKIEKNMVKENKEVINACSQYPLSEVEIKNKVIIKINKKEINKHISKIAKRKAIKSQKRVEAQQDHNNRGEK